MPKKVAVSHGPASGIPARGETRPPFAVGNTLRLGNGARSKLVYRPLAAELAAGLLDERPDLARYPNEVAAWSEWEARALLLRRHLNEHGDLDGNGPDANTRDSATRWLATCEKHAATRREALGLTPLSEARLAKERASAALVSVDLAAVAERGRAALAARASDPDVEPLAITDGEDRAGAILAEVAEEGRRRWEKARAEHNGWNFDEATGTAVRPDADDGTDDEEGNR